jgi:hypothetical protein
MVSLVYQVAPVVPGSLFWLLWLIPPIGAAASLAWVLYQSRQRSRYAAMRQSLAFQRSKTQLDSLAKTGANSRKAYEKIQSVVLGYFGDRLNKNTREWTTVELETSLVQINAPGEIKQRILLCLAWVDEGLYAPTPSVEVATLAKRTAETLAVLDQNWKQTP